MTWQIEIEDETELEDLKALVGVGPLEPFRMGAGRCSLEFEWPDFERLANDFKNARCGCCDDWQCLGA